MMNLNSDHENCVFVISVVLYVMIMINYVDYDLLLGWSELCDVCVVALLNTPEKKTSNQCTAVMLLGMQMTNMVSCKRRYSLQVR